MIPLSDHFKDKHLIDDTGEIAFANPDVTTMNLVAECIRDYMDEGIGPTRGLMLVAVLDDLQTAVVRVEGQHKDVYFSVACEDDSAEWEVWGAHDSFLTALLMICDQIKGLKR